METPRLANLGATDLPGLTERVMAFTTEQALGDLELARAITRAVYTALGGSLGQSFAKVTERAPHLPPAPGTPLRGRYMIRIMLSRGDSVEADTDPEQPPDARPTMPIVGMHAILDTLAEVVRPFHAARQEPEPELDMPALERRLSALRVSLSRSAGDTWWHARYLVGLTEWSAAVHVVRE